MAVPTPGARRLLRYLPDYYGDEEEVDPLVGRILDALASEPDRVRALLSRIRASCIPGASDDGVGGVAAWERALSLPVRPGGILPDERAGRVLGALRGRRVASAAAYVRTVRSIAPGANVYPRQPDPDNVTIEVAFTGGYNLDQLEDEIRAYTPAHIVLVFRYAEGFLVGVSRVGDAL